jgi:hypothetical protein
VIDLARRLPTDEALTAARDMRDAVSRVRTLGEIAQRLPAKEKARLLDEALGLLRNIDVSEERDRALAQIIKWRRQRERWRPPAVLLIQRQKPGSWWN